MVEWPSVFPVVKSCGEGQWMARCPAHEDGNASLSVRLAEDKVLLKCHAGCELSAIVGAVDLKVGDLFYEKRERPKDRIIGTYSYRDENGRELFQVLRMEPKSFRQRHRVNGDWLWKMDGVRRVPYCLDEITKRSNTSVIVVEGEKDADRLRGLGLLATCNSGGAGKWPEEFGGYFTGRSIAVLPDNDDAGWSHAADVAGSMMIHGAGSVRVVRLPVKAKGDVSDYLNDGKTKDELIQVIRGSQYYIRQTK